MADSYDPENENEAFAEDDPGINSTSEPHDQPDSQELQTLMAGLDKLLKKYEDTYYGDEPDEVQQPKLHHHQADISNQCFQILLHDPGNQEVAALHRDYTAALLGEFYGHEGIPPEEHKPKLRDYIVGVPRPDDMDSDDDGGDDNDEFGGDDQPGDDQSYDQGEEHGQHQQAFDDHGQYQEDGQGDYGDQNYYDGHQDPPGEDQEQGPGQEQEYNEDYEQSYEQGDSDQQGYGQDQGWNQHQYDGGDYDDSPHGQQHDQNDSAEY